MQPGIDIAEFTWQSFVELYSEVSDACSGISSLCLRFGSVGLPQDAAFQDSTLRLMLLASCERCLAQVYEKSLSTIQVVDGQLVRKVKVVKVWLEANLFSQKYLGKCIECASRQ